MLATHLPAPAGHAKVPHDDARYAPYQLKEGLWLPYPLDNPFRGWARCKRGDHSHRALDIGGVGPDWGVGTPVRAMAKARVTHIGGPWSNEKKYGRPDKRPGTTKRGKSELPRSATIPNYGRVYFFTRERASRIGGIVALRILEGPLKGHKIKYMHLAAAHPKLRVGSVVQGGQEIGLMGGTAVMDSAPHVHLQIEDAKREKLDVGPILGIGRTYYPCKQGKVAKRAIREVYTKKARALMKRLREERRDAPVMVAAADTSDGAAPAKPKRVAARKTDPRTLTGCGEWIRQGSFAKARKAHELTLDAEGKGGAWRIRVRRTEGPWKPRLHVLDGDDKLVSGFRANKRDRQRYKIKLRADGRSHGKADLELRPRRGQRLTLRVDAWDWLKPPKSGRFEVEVSRACSSRR